MAKVSIYVDGFNFYYGALRNTSFRWLDLKALSAYLIPPNSTIRRIKYFTARVSGAVDPDAPRRQQIYLSALCTIPEVEIFYGHFLAKSIWRPIVNLPVGNNQISTNPATLIPPGTYNVSGNPQETLVVGNYPQQGVPRRRQKPHSNALKSEVYAMEEKGSDVNLAAHLLNDAWRGEFDMAVVISNDTDLVSPIYMVTIERQLPVTVACPGRWSMAPKLRSVASFVKHIRRNWLSQSQFPNPIPGTNISKPVDW